MKNTITYLLSAVMVLLLCQLGYQPSNPVSNSFQQDKEKLADHEKEFLATIHFLMKKLPEGNPFALDSVQKEKLTKFNEYAETLLDGRQDEQLIKEMEEESGYRWDRDPQSKRLEYYKRGKIWEQFLSIKNEFLDFQLNETLSWSPERIGIVKSLTETPFGDAAGLDERSKEKIRQRANELGNELYDKYVTVRAEMEQLLSEHVDQEFFAEWNDIYYPDSSSDYTVMKQSLGPRQLIWTLVYEFDSETGQKLKTIFK